MPNLGQKNFNTGEVTEKIDVRTDLAKYPGASRRSDNMIPTVFGGSTRRPGTEFIVTSTSFDEIVDSILSYEDEGVCYEDDVVAILDISEDEILCYEDDILCYEDEVVATGDVPIFVLNALCYEDDVLFYENDILIL